MKLLDERQQIKDCIVNFRKKWGDGSYPADKRGIMVGAELGKLDPDKATAKDIAGLIGNDSWVHPETCDECGQESWGIVEMGQPPDYESSTAQLCEKCLENGLRLLRNMYKIKVGTAIRGYPTILKALGEEHVFYIDKQVDGTFEVTEACDNYFSIFLTREQMLVLAEEIRQLAES